MKKVLILIIIGIITTLTVSISIFASSNHTQRHNCPTECVEEYRHNACNDQRDCATECVNHPHFDVCEDQNDCNSNFHHSNKHHNHH